MRPLVLVALVGILGAVAAATGPASSGATAPQPVKPRVFKLNWNERRTLDTGFVHFRVRRLEVRPTGWRVTGGFTNRSPYTLRIVRNPPDVVKQLPTYRMSMVAYVVRDRPLGVTVSPREFPARTVSPALPPELEPGATWNGTFTGPQRLPRKVALSPAFGYFFYSTDNATYGFDWVTTRSVRL